MRRAVGRRLAPFTGAAAAKDATPAAATTVAPASSAPPAPPAAVSPASPETGPQPYPPGADRVSIRREHVFATADPNGLALEIGPAHNPVLPKREGFNARTVDYLDRERLVEKYASFEQYSPDDIEEVDFVLAPGSAMADVIDERFDLVLASHVIEHTTSLIAFVNECARLLRPGGVLALVVPDQRYCFDRFRERSSIGAIIDADLDPKDLHSVGTLTEFALLAVRHRGITAWAPRHRGRYSFAHDAERVRTVAASAHSGHYIDVHHWVFTPHHLRLILNDLADLGYIGLREAYWHDTIGHEFFLNLTAEASGPTETRSALLRLADDEKRVLDVPEWEPGQEPEPPSALTEFETASSEEEADPAPHA